MEHEGQGTYGAVERKDWRLCHGRERYDQYLLSDEWLALKQAVYRRSGRVCERCGNRGVRNVHHLTFERLYCEALDDLLGVCRACHGLSRSTRPRHSTPDRRSWGRILMIAEAEARTEGP